jgi:hypothetical protein
VGLLSRFRRRRRDEDYVGRHRPGAWGELALPPIEPAPPAAAPVAPADRPISAAPAPAVIEALVAPTAVEPAAPAPPLATAPHAVQPAPVAITARQRVRLGFADGSSVEIEDASRTSDELITAAARLIDDPR